MIELFVDEISKCANVIKSLVKLKKPVVISHYDADGLTSAAIITKNASKRKCEF